MVKSTKASERMSCPARVKPDIIDRLTHLAVDEMKSVKELIEEGMPPVPITGEALKRQ